MKVLVLFLFVLLCVSFVYLLNDSNDSINELKQERLTLILNNSNLIQQINELKQYTKTTQQDCMQEQKALEVKYNQNVVRKNVTLQEVKDFIFIDKTDLKMYSMPNYVCVDFTDDFIYNAYVEGIFACRTYLEYKEQPNSHSLVAIKTNKGVVYIEPQTDKIIYSLNVGDNFCKKLGNNCTKTIKKMTSCFRNR